MHWRPSALKVRLDFVNLKNKNGDQPRLDKTIEKAILRIPRAWLTKRAKRGHYGVLRSGCCCLFAALRVGCLMALKGSLRDEYDQTYLARLVGFGCRCGGCQYAGCRAATEAEHPLHPRR